MRCESKVPGFNGLLCRVCVKGRVTLLEADKRGIGPSWPRHELCMVTLLHNLALAHHCASERSFDSVDSLSQQMGIWNILW